MLKDARNERNGRFYIKENLTLQRRLLRDRARAELPSYRYQWVKYGTIYLRKDDGSRSIRLQSETQLEKLIAEQNEVPPGIPIRPRESFVNALKKQKAYGEFDFERVAPILKNSEELPAYTFENFPPLPILINNTPVAK